MKQGSQSLVVSTTRNNLSSGVAKPKEKEGMPDCVLQSKIIKDIVTKLTGMPRPIIDIIMILPLSKDNYSTIISVHAPIMTNPDGNKEAFYNQLASALSGIPRTDKLLLIGDLNARIEDTVTCGPWSWTNMGLGNATPMARFYWFCALSSN